MTVDCLKAQSNYPYLVYGTPLKRESTKDTRTLIDTLVIAVKVFPV